MADIPTLLSGRIREAVRPAWLAMLFGAATALTAVVVLAGWQLDIELLKRIRPQYVAMNPATAVAFLFAGVALIILSMSKLTRLWRGVAGVLGGLTLFIGALRIIGYAWSWDSEVDQWLFASRLGDNRMAPNTAISFLFSGAAIGCIVVLPRWRFLRSLLVWFAALLPTMALIGYSQGVVNFYQIGIFIPMALHTAICFTAVVIGLIAWNFGDVAAQVMGEPVATAGPHAASYPPAPVDSLWKLERKVGTAFGAALFLLTIVGIVAYRSTDQLIDAMQSNNHSRQVIADVNVLLARITDVETGQRGYVITRHESFLEPYEEALVEIPHHLQSLRAMIDDDPDRQRHLNDLTTLIESKLAGAERSIQLRQQGDFISAQNLIASGEGKRLMDQIRGEADRMIAAEQSLLDARIEDVNLTAHAVVLVVIGGCCVAFMLVAGAGWFIHRDIAERRKAERQLHELRKTAETANHAKSEFLANMSHEIRTPMTAILGYADLLLDHNLDPSDRLNHLNVIRRNGQHLLAIINDILDLSKIEAGQLKTESVACRPCQVLSEVASILRVRAVEKHLTLQVKIEGKIPEVIHSDPMRLRQVLINLIGNAIKFTDHGWVRLTVSLIDPPDATNPRMQFQVTDTGVGMTAQQIANLFRPFGQVDNSPTRRFGGTGLGLVISQRMVREMGGDITVESDPGRGSRFTATIQTGTLRGVKLLSRCTESLLQSETQSAAPVSALRGRVLLVEDGIDNRRLLKLYLTRAGMEVDEAENGREGCDGVQEAQIQHQPYDLVLMDMQMPVMDGYTATARLRAAGCKIPIIALTAHAMIDDRDKCLTAGCTDYLPKPVERNKLLRTVAKYLQSQDTQPPTLHSDPHLDEDVRELLPQFIGDLPHTVGRMLSLLESHDLDQLAILIHRIKGAAGQYGFMPITDLATAVDAQLKTADESDTESIEAAVHELIELIRRVEGYDAVKESDVTV